MKGGFEHFSVGDGIPFLTQWNKNLCWDVLTVLFSTCRCESVGSLLAPEAYPQSTALDGLEPLTNWDPHRSSQKYSIFYSHNWDAGQMTWAEAEGRIHPGNMSVWESRQGLIKWKYGISTIGIGASRGVKYWTRMFHKKEYGQHGLTSKDRESGKDVSKCELLYDA